MGKETGEIRTGERVLDYSLRMEEICRDLEEAYENAAACCGTLLSGEAYQGDGLEEMQIYFQSLARHLQKMYLFCRAGRSYIQETYRTMYYNEQRLAGWLQDQLL